MENKASDHSDKLWTKDFSIITWGTVISMFGDALTGFAASLLVLDYTESTFMYALTLGVYTAPQIIMPILSGAILDRVSRRVTIYALDFISAGLYLAAAFIVDLGMLSMPLLLIFVFVMGSISSIYRVAYDSFYPLLVKEEYYSKAYSIASMLETISAVMVPVAAALYNAVGIVPIFFINAGTFFAAAVMETQIGKGYESYVDRQKQTATESSRMRQMFTDVREGVKYIISDRGLAAITIFFFATTFLGAPTQVLFLPYFRENYANGEYVFMIVMGSMLLGRFLGGLNHYRREFPPEKKYTIAMIVYVATSFTGGFMLFVPLPAMVAMGLLEGILGVTSYTIRISATQSYVPDEKKGRFNGAFTMLNTVGMLLGELVSGALASVFSTPGIVLTFMMINAVIAVVVIGGNKKAVSLIYNR
ncbi:MAG: MFS transporter [Eubacterium sp.]|jgi:MFS family permease